MSLCEQEHQLLPSETGRSAHGRAQDYLFAHEVIDNASTRSTQEEVPG